MRAKAVAGWAAGRSPLVVVVSATKRNNLFNSSHGLKAVELSFCRANIDIETSGDVGKSKVCILAGINLVNVHIETATLRVPGLKVGHSNGLGWRRTLDDISSTAGNA